MATVFISGSREISFIPEEIRGRIDRIIDSGLSVIVGDSERGVDSAVLRYLESRAYEDVSVYSVHDEPRVKCVLDAWTVRKVEPSIEKKVDKSGNIRNMREIETEKDRAMGALADYGLVVWQSTYKNRFGNLSASKGSLRNMHQLLSDNKPVVLYKVTPNEFEGVAIECHELRSLEELREIVFSEPEVVRKSFADIEKKASLMRMSLFGANDSCFA